MAPRGTRLLLALVVAAGLVSLGAVTSAASAAGPYTSLALRGDPDDGVLHGTDVVYGPDAGIQLQGDAHSVQVQVDGWVLNIVGPGTDGPLVPGQTYTGATPYLSSYSGPQLSLWGGGSGYCSETTSTFTIRELTTDLSGKVVAFNAVFEQHCGASASAARGSVAVSSTIAPITLPPMLSAQIRHPQVAYGDPVTLEVHLSADAPSHEVAVYLTPDGQSEELVLLATVTGNNRSKLEVTLPVSGQVTVRWSGGGTFPDLAASVTVSVSGQIVSRLRGGTRKAGRTHLVPASRTAVLVAALRPDHQGDCLRFHAQYFVRGRWGYDGVVKCLRLDKHSAAGVSFPGDRRLIGLPIRLRAEWRGDSLNTKAKGKWQYLRFVAG
jgi:hypothetical protein